MKPVLVCVVWAIVATLPAVGEDRLGTDLLNRLLATKRYSEALEEMRRIPDINALSEGGGNTPLTVAADITSDNAYDMVHALLFLGADPNKRNREGRTALHYAARAGVLSVVHLLVNRFGADPTSPVQVRGGKPDEEETPIVWAARSGHVRVVEFLESHGATLPQRIEVDMRYILARRAHYDRMYASNVHKEAGPFRHTLIGAMADIQALNDMRAPERVVEFAHERLKVVQKLMNEPSWQERSPIELFTESHKKGASRMSLRPGFREHLREWNDRRGR